MQAVIKAYFSQFDFLSQKEIEVFLEHSEVREWEQGKVILKTGVVHNPGVVLEGLVRYSFVSESGDDKTLWFARQGALLSDPISVLDNVPATIEISAIENCKILHFDHLKLNENMMKHPGLLRFRHLMLEFEVKDIWRRMMFFSTLSPEERFAAVLKYEGDLVDRVKQKYLASYIGVSEVSYSRIKNRLRSS